MILYHGTSVEAATNITEKGFENKIRNFRTSVDGMTYFNTENNSIVTYPGMIHAAITNSHYNSIAVIPIELDDEIYNAYFAPDETEAPYYDKYRKQIETAKLNQLVKDGKIKIRKMLLLNIYNSSKKSELIDNDYYKAVGIM